MTQPNFASGTIWTGDNLEIMRGMNSACVDLIYLDPPFNSNRTYSAPIGSVAAGAAFKDAWTLDDVDEFEHGELAERNPAAGAVIEAARLAHGKPMMAYLIFMTVRLLEMRRILKPAGSIYLHCDDAAGHWLRVLMESVFGAAAFRNEVIWKRIGNHNDAGRFGRTADRLLFYGAAIHRDAVRVPLHDANVTSKYRYHDERGVYRTGDLTGPGVSQGEAGEPWRGWDPTDIGRCWSVPRTGAYAAWIEANLIPGYRTKPSILARLELLDRAGLIAFHGQRHAGDQALPCRQPRSSAAGCLDRYPAGELASSGAHRLPDTEAADAAGSDHPGIEQSWRPGAGPVLRLRYHPGRCGPPRARVGRHRPVAPGYQTGQRPDHR